MKIEILRTRREDTIQYDLKSYSTLQPQLHRHKINPAKNVIISVETADDYYATSGNDIEQKCIPVVLIGVTKSQMEQILVKSEEESPYGIPRLPAMLIPEFEAYLYPKADRSSIHCSTQNKQLSS